jgi:hypothetical protein
MNKYEADLEIDKHNIDQELLRQPQLYYDWAKAEAKAEERKDAAKDKLDLVLVEVEDEIRSNPERFMEHSATEGAIRAAVGKDRRVRRAKRKFRKAKSEWKILQKAEKAFEMRKRMLESYLYHIHKMMQGDVKVPRKYEERVSQRTRQQIEEELGPEMKRFM